jgi:hypothetical protein
MVEDAQKIVKFIRACHVPLALVCKHAAIHAQGLSLLSLGATQFATNFLMFDRVFNVKGTKLVSEQGAGSEERGARSGEKESREQGLL